MAADIPGSNGRKDLTLVREAKPLSFHWTIASMPNAAVKTSADPPDGKETWKSIDMSQER